MENLSIRKVDMGLLPKLENVAAESEKVKERMREAAQKELIPALNEATKLVFEKYPKMEKIGWVQYTPYFNDGDPCVFMTDGPFFYIPNPDDEFPEETLNNILEWDYSAHFEKDSLAESFNKAFNKIDNELFEVAFGDYSQIIITRDGKLTNECYDHD